MLLRKWWIPTYSVKTFKTSTCVISEGHIVAQKTMTHRVPNDFAKLYFFPALSLSLIKKDKKTMDATVELEKDDIVIPEKMFFKKDYGTECRFSESGSVVQVIGEKKSLKK